MEVSLSLGLPFVLYGFVSTEDLFQPQLSEHLPENLMYHIRRDVKYIVLMIPMKFRLFYENVQGLPVCSKVEVSESN